MFHRRILSPKNSKICLLFDAYKLDFFTLARYRSLQVGLKDLYDVFFVFHGSLDAAASYPSNTLILNDERIFSQIPAGKAKGRTLIPGNCDLKLLAAIEEISAYETFIFMEFDVVCINDVAATFGRLIDALAGVDFAGSYIETPSQNPSWPWWSSIKPAPRTQLDPSHLLRRFLPLAAYSRPFMLTYRHALLDGWEGHQEVLLPTIARRNDMSMMILNHSRNNFTSWPAFDATRPEGLDRPELPAFIHPVKNIADHGRLPSTIRGMSHIEAMLAICEPVSI